MIPDPVELMEMRAERMMERHFRADRPGMFLCAACDRWCAEVNGMSSASDDPSSPPICGLCFESFFKTDAAEQLNKGE